MPEGSLPVFGNIWRSLSNDSKDFKDWRSSKIAVCFDQANKLSCPTVNINVRVYSIHTKDE